MRVHPVKEKTIWQDIKNYLKEYCRTSNIHGVHYLAAKRSKIERLSWAFFLLLSVSCCIFMIFKMWQKYENNPIVINFASRQLSVYDVPFPAVTVCPNSKCNRFKFNYSDVYYKLREEKMISDEELQIFRSLCIVCDNEVEFEQLSDSKSLDDNFFNIITKLTPALLTICSFQGEEVHVCDNRTVLPVITEEGICYSFNMLQHTEIFKQNVFLDQDIDDDHNGSDFNIDTGYATDAGVLTHPRRTYTSGFSNGLSFVLMNNPSETDPLCTSYSQGYKVLIHSPLDFPRFSTHYFQASFNKITMVAVHPDVITTSEEVKKFTPETRKCYLGSERSLKFFRTYTQSNCLLECLTNYTLTECGCVSFYMPRTNDTKICGIANDKCVGNARAKMINSEIANRNDTKGTTLCDCKPSCNNWQYVAEISDNDYDFSKYIDVNFPEIKEQVDDMNFSIVAVYLKNEHFLSLERTELYSIFDFISNFGGLLGLFIGFSLLSLIEIVYFFTLRMFYNNRLFGDWFNSV